VLVPISNVLFGGSGSNRTVQVRPALNQSGSALLTIRALDASGGINDAPFTLTVTPLNDAPSLPPIPDQVMNEDTTLGPIPLTLNDPEPGPLTLTVDSSNPALLPPASIVSGGSGQNQTLTFSPLTNQFGDSIVTIIVADGEGASATNRFRVTVNPVNDPPGIDSIADLYLPLNAGPQNVALTGINSGASNEAQPLWVSAVSSNPQLIPHPSVTFAGPPAGSLSFTPAAGVGGLATITVSVNDGQAQNNITTRDFTVTIETAPSFAAMADVHTDEDVAAGPIPLAILDTDTPLAALALQATSSNPQLLANSNIVLSATPTNHALTLTPSPNQHGFSIVTLVATDDDGNAGTNTFAFIVHPVNDTPFVSPIPDQDTATNQAVGPIAFRISDLETPAAQLEVTASSSNTELVPHAGITLGRANRPDEPGDTRTISIQPAPDRAGASTITITVNDPNGGATSETFVVRVSDSPVAPFITTHPADQTVFPGGSATFLVTAGGTHPMTYLWRHDGTAIPGTASPILSLSGIAPSQAGQYTVIISNAAGTVTSTPARLSVPFDLRIASIAWAAGTVTLTFETYAGATYTVEHADSLAAPSWTALQTLTGNGATASVTDPAPGSMRFYRLTLD
jgi:hypothetical protein